MEYLWKDGQAHTFAGLLEFFNDVRQKDWCKQTLNTNLLRLKKRGYLLAEKSGTKTMYSPAITRLRYEQMCAEEILQESYGGALSNFVAALTGRKALTESEGRELMKYFSLKKLLLKKAEPLGREEWQEKASGRYGRDMGKRVCYARHPDMKTPFTIGIWKHWIILPDRKLTEEERRIICLHEMTHIKNRDILKKIICLGILLFHWFNPAAWILLYEYGVISEQICDEQVAVTLKTQEEKNTQRFGENGGKGY